MKYFNEAMILLGAMILMVTSQACGGGYTPKKVVIENPDTDRSGLKPCTEEQVKTEICRDNIEYTCTKDEFTNEQFWVSRRYCTECVKDECIEGMCYENKFTCMYGAMYQCIDGIFEFVMFCKGANCEKSPEGGLSGVCLDNPVE